MINKAINFDDISDSIFFGKIKNRFTDFMHFEEFLDNNDSIYVYDYKKEKYSKIKASYLLQCFNGDRVFFIFLDLYKNGPNKGKCFCRTFFEQEQIDFTQWQTKWVLLRKEKINLKTNELLLEQGKSLIDLNISKDKGWDINISCPLFNCHYFPYNGIIINISYYYIKKKYRFRI